MGMEIGKKYGVEFLLADFKKREGYKRSIELSKEYDLYRQDYCGCKFSLNQSDGKDCYNIAVRVECPWSSAITTGFHTRVK